MPAVNAHIAPGCRWTGFLSASIVLLLALSSCRRDLWVYTDDFRQLELRTDWSRAEEVPGGMTWWFMNDDQSGQNRHETTAEIYQTWLSLPRGTFSGVVFDYSPAEYSHIEFLDMTRADDALAHLRAAADQPLPDEQLYGDQAVAPGMQGIPRNPETGMYLVAAEPEIMDADTLRHINIVTGTDGDLIHWDERDEYESTITVQTLHAQPKPIVWQLLVTVQVRGIGYMGSLTGSVAGLTDGCWLGTLRHTSTPCLQQLDTWESHYLNDSIGYVTTTVRTFGLPDLDMPPSPTDARADQATRATDVLLPPHYEQHLQLNLQFLLRDNATVLNYHFNVGNDCITIIENQLVVRIDIPIDYPDAPDLPYVEAYDGTGFNATVTPWKDGGTADTTM